MVTKVIIGWALIVLVLLMGCLLPEAQGAIGDSDLAQVTPAQTPATPVSGTLDEPPTASMTPEVRHSPSATPTLSPTPTTTVTPTATPAPERLDVRVCSQTPQLFNLKEHLGIQPVSALRFESEELVTFEGWGARPEPLITPVYREPTLEGPVPWPSVRILLKAGQLDLSNGQLSPRPLDVGQLLANPCGQTCPLEVIGQSPDGQWQLVQVSDWLPEVVGLWLVSQKTSDRLVHYVPYAPKWQWAADNSLLWLVYPDPEFGSYTLVARLTDPPAIQRPTSGSVLDNYGHFLAYSPSDNVALSVPSYEWPDQLTDEVSTIPLANSLESVSAIQNVPGIVTISWNEATQSFVAQVVTTDGIQFMELPGGTIWNIPKETLQALFPTLVDVPTFLPTGLTVNWAISASGNTLALMPNPALLWVFDCAPSG